MTVDLQPSLTRRYLGQMRREIMRFTRLRRFFYISLLWLAAPSICRSADPVAELGSFSVFEKTDLAELAKSGPKTIHGPPMGGRYLSVQSCYIMPGEPARQLEAMRFPIGPNCLCPAERRRSLLTIMRPMSGLTRS